MRTARQIRESIAEFRDELDSIIAVSEREERDLSEDESARAVEITEKLIPFHNTQLKTATNIEKERLARAEKRFEDELAANKAAAGVTEDSDGGFLSIRGTIKIPAKARMYGELKAFKGPTAEQDAYISGMAILAGIFNNDAAKQFCRNIGLQVHGTMTTGTNSAGGFLVPDEMSRAIIRLREERGIFPRFANNLPMGSDIVMVPRLLSDVTAYWVGEGVEITASEPTLGQAEIMARKLGALTKISSELDEDAVIQIGDMVTMSMAYAMSDKIDEAGFNGDGTSTYGGVVGLKNALHANAIIQSLTGNDAGNNQDLADFEKIVGLYPQYTGASPRWYMHSAMYWGSFGRLADAAGGNTSANFASGPNTAMLLGYPVTFVQVMPSTTTTLANTIIAYFGDLRLAATYGTRRSFKTQVSTERYFELDLIGIKATERVGVLIHETGDTIRTRPIIAMKTAA